MKKIKIGRIYTARPDSELSPSELETRMQLTEKINAKAEEMARKYDATRLKAQQDIYDRREQRIVPEI